MIEVNLIIFEDRLNQEAVDHLVWTLVEKIKRELHADGIQVDARVDAAWHIR